MKKKEILIIISTIGGASIIVGLFLPWYSEEPWSVFALLLIEPGNLATLFIFLSSIILATLMIALGIVIIFARSRIRNLCWNVNLAIAVIAFLLYVVWWLIARYQPFAFTPGFVCVPGPGVYSGLIGSLLALAGLILYKFWK